MNDFERYALSRGISSLTTEQYLKSTYINPTIIEERKLNVAAMDVFSRLQMERIIFLGSEINDDVANVIQAQLLWLSSLNDEPISLYINSPGGIITSGMAIYDTMQIIEPKVATICTGMAASMAAVLFCSGEKGERSILPHSRVLIHQPLGGARGQASDILIEAKEIEKARAELVQIISEKTGQDYDKVFKDMDRDYWMSAKEAVEYGICDKILDKKNKK